MVSILKTIKPHQVSRDLSGYSVFFYGTPKSGKTTIASQFPGALLLAFEKGYNAIPGVKAAPINKWKDFKVIMQELKELAEGDSEEIKKLKEDIKTIVIDTADIAYQYCTEYICNLNDVEAIGDIGYGKGYTLVSNEFDKSLRQICNWGYGLVLISHSKDKTFKDETGNEYNQIVPTLEERGRLICERTCDIIGYSRTVNTETGAKTKLYLRGTPRFVAGSRFKYIPESIIFTYENLTQAILTAIEKEANETGNKFITEERSNLYADKTSERPSFENRKKEFDEKVETLMSLKTPKVAAPLILEIVESYLGKGKRVAECTSKQLDQIELIIYDLDKLISEK